MPTFRERVTDYLLGSQRQQLQGLTKQLYEAYLSGPYLLPPDQLISQLKEYDSSLVYDLVNQLAYDNLGSLGYTNKGMDELRRIIDESRRLYTYDVISQWIVWLWTNFGFGENIHITPEDEGAADVPCGGFVDLAGVQPPDVVGFEDAGIDGHRSA